MGLSIDSEPPKDVTPKIMVDYVNVEKLLQDMPLTQAPAREKKELSPKDDLHVKEVPKQSGC